MFFSGYFRKAEVEMATFHFEKALTSYTKAFCLQKDDHSLMDSMKKAARELKKDQKAEKDIPWLGALAVNYFFMILNHLLNNYLGVLQVQV